ncbi:hypothetical protein BDZ89DRAFT_960811, partial [Hymenopellis radicata]
DILREIFLFACARSTKGPSHFYIIPPSLLTAVCRSWNHIAVTFPQLWRQCVLSISSAPFPSQANLNFSRANQSAREYQSNVSQVSGVALAISRSIMCLMDGSTAGR